MTTKIPVELSSTPGIVDSSNATAITIDSSENVGIGTSSPAYLLHLQASTDTDLNIISGTSVGDFGSILFGDTDYPAEGRITYQNSDNKMRFWSDRQHVMTLDDNARVGIGTESPSTKLEVNGGIRLSGLNGGDGLKFDMAGSTDYVIKESSTNDVFSFGGQIHHNISSGKVGIGTTAPARTFHINSADANIASFEGHQGEGLVFNSGTDGRFDIIGYDDGASSYNAIHIRASSGNGLQFTTSGTYLFGTTTNKTVGDNPADENSTVIGPGYMYLQRDDSAELNQIVFGKDGQIAGRIVTTTATSLVSASDYRMKENVDYTWDATSRLKQLKPARYNWIADETNTLEDGFLAHEVSSVVPNAVFGEKDAVDSDGNPEMQGVDQSKLVPLLVKTIQELETRITTLEGE